jgi:hypothetical protein
MSYKQTPTCDSEPKGTPLCRAVPSKLRGFTAQDTRATIRDCARGDPERGPELCCGLQHRACEALLVGRGHAGDEETAGRREEVGADGDEGRGWEAECPVARSGVEECEEQWRARSANSPERCDEVSEDPRRHARTAKVPMSGMTSTRPTTYATKTSASTADTNIGRRRSIVCSGLRPRYV